MIPAYFEHRWPWLSSVLVYVLAQLGLQHFTNAIEIVFDTSVPVASDKLVR
jgi:uncharacterized membrane protein YfhO